MDYNKKEDDLFELEEWIKPDKVITNENYIENDEVYRYVARLRTLGYNIDESYTMKQIRDVVKQFQQDEGLEATGYLDDKTKMKIDSNLRKSNMTSAKVRSGTMIYSGPYEGCESKTVLSSETVAYIIQGGFNGWVYVQLEDGTTCYIRQDDLYT